MTGSFRQADVTWDYGFKDLATEEISEVRGYLFRECGAFIVHSQNYALDGKIGVQRFADPHQRIEQF